MPQTDKYSIFWFRRDLRLHDNKALHFALRSDYPVIPVFIFDRNILEKLLEKTDARVQFIHRELLDIRKKLNEIGSDLNVRVGRPKKVWEELIEKYNIAEVFTNRDYEPYAVKRDTEIGELLKNKGISFNTYNDHVITEAGEVMKEDGDPYVVFTPYKRKWLEVVGEGLEADSPLSKSRYFATYSTGDLKTNFAEIYYEKGIPELSELGFKPSPIPIPPREVERKVIKDYSEMRDFPALDATSRLGIHFRFGTISVRQKAAAASELDETYLSELIWRDFYAQILAHFPRVENGPFKERYASIEWINDEGQFEKWCNGKTGFPLVDAGMRQLNETGFMHNRVRMLTASFLCKHLLIDWRWGEAYFAGKLLDYELASNNGGWQWAAGCGTDTAPYFRIFNPELQLNKFDKNLDYVKKYVPEFGTDNYPKPMVDHREARKRCLEVYKKALDS